MTFTPADHIHMARALELAQRGQGRVEPNPMVGCVLVEAAAAASGSNSQVIAEGWHNQYGGPHAEAAALIAAEHAGAVTTGATAYVTLEPCCHFGKTPPCADALIAAGVSRVVVAARDPAPHVDGGGFQRLADAGIAVESGLMESAAMQLLAPYLKLLRTGRPWVIAKWAATLDGKIGTHTGDSKWISSAASRQIVHQIRGRADAIITGSGTAIADNPQLTARPQNSSFKRRTPLRVVIDSAASLPLDSHLARTARQIPVLVAVGSAASQQQVAALSASGCEIFTANGQTHAERLDSLLLELGRRRLTNVLLEAGSRVLGAMADGGHVDEVHVFIAPRLAGGGMPAFNGTGVDTIAAAPQLVNMKVQQIENDVYISGMVHRPTAGDSAAPDNAVPDIAVPDTTDG